MENGTLHGTLREIANDYWDQPIRTHMLADADRTAFQVSLVAPKAKSVCDIGGGLAMFSLACSALGMRSTLVDDFGDQYCIKTGNQAIFDLFRRHHVNVINRDVISDGIGELAGQTFDVITTFDSMEHWHNSPKRLFRELLGCLNPGGTFVIGVPNCVNLRKRITVPLGNGKWTSMEQWYEIPFFRDHVREPDVDDLHYIARDMGLANVRILGRNWLGYKNDRPWVRAITPYVDRLLQLRPSICSDIYMVGNKP